MVWKTKVTLTLKTNIFTLVASFASELGLVLFSLRNKGTIFYENLALLKFELGFKQFFNQQKMFFFIDRFHNDI
jgi:hypothetical protein